MNLTSHGRNDSQVAHIENYIYCYGSLHICVKIAKIEFTHLKLQTTCPLVIVLLCGPYLNHSGLLHMCIKIAKIEFKQLHFNLDHGNSFHNLK